MSIAGSSLTIALRQVPRIHAVAGNKSKAEVTGAIAAMAPDVAVPRADPGDRSILATAQVHELPVVTSDHLIARCADVDVLW